MSDLQEPCGPLRVVIVEDDPQTLDCLKHNVASDPRLHVAAEFGLAQPAMAWLRDHACDVLLCDLGLPDRSGIDLIERCALWQPDCDILVISMFGDENNVLRAVEAGASGYLLKGSEEADIVGAIATLRDGGSPMSPLIARRLLKRLQGKPPAAPGAGRHDGEARPQLTRRETQTISLIARGYSYLEVAQTLGVTLSTVQTHIKSSYRKLAVTSRGQAVAEAQRQGLLLRREDDIDPLPPRRTDRA